LGWGSDSGDVFENDHVLLDAGVSALLLHRGEILDLKVDDALFIAGLLSLVHEVADSVEMLSFSIRGRLHLFTN
jgi:hypothetical protein